jgi:hypothetical protein
MKEDEIMAYTIVAWIASVASNGVLPKKETVVVVVVA